MKTGFLTNNRCKNTCLSIVTKAALLFYFFSIIAFDSSIFFYFASALFVITSLCYFVFGNKIRIREYKIQPFITFMALFILYNFLLNNFENIPYPDYSNNRLLTVTLNFVIGLFVYMFCLEKDNRISAMKMFVMADIIFVLYLIIAGSSSILSGRFGEGISYPFGISQTYNSNMVCIAGYTSLAFASFLRRDALKNSKRKNIALFYLFIEIILILTIFLSGSRAGLFVGILFIIFNLLFSSKNKQRLFFNILISIFVILISYLLVMKIDFLYDIIGKRIELLLSGLGSSASFDSGTSVGLRQEMIDYSFALFGERPLSGWGLDAFSQLFRYDAYSHNNFTELLVSCGIIGFLLYYFSIFSILIVLIKNVREKRDCESIVLFSLLLSTLILNVAHVDYVNRKSIFLFYLSAALASKPKKSFIRKGCKKHESAVVIHN